VHGADARKSGCTAALASRPLPEDEYCGVAPALVARDRRGDWDSLPAPVLDTATAAQLAAVMPGTRSALERHEWLKHGTCSGLSAEAYFGRAIALTTEINQSALGQLFASHVGRQLTSGDVAGALSRDFGSAAGRRVAISCRRDGSRDLITELEFSLHGDITTRSLADLLAEAEPVAIGCRRGVVDPAGRQ
jgi:ribonuclease T2